MMRWSFNEILPAPVPPVRSPEHAASHLRAVVQRARANRAAGFAHESKRDTVARVQAYLDALDAMGARRFHAADAADAERELRALQAAREGAPRGGWFQGLDGLSTLRFSFGGLGEALPLRDVAFRRWFGASKVVDAQGKPLVVYHGTPQADFTRFDPGEAGRRTGRNLVGIYFSNAGAGAQTYAGWRAPILERRDFADLRRETAELKRDRWGEGERRARPGVYAVYLRIERPFVVDFQGRSWEDRAVSLDDGEVYWGMDEITDVAAGFPDSYDGVIARNVCDEGPFGQGYCHGDTTYVVWDPKQIKSANANSGAFSSKTDNILQGLGFGRRRR